MNIFSPVFLTDKSTFCTHIYNACVEQGKTPVADKRDFVNDCAARYPTTIKKSLVLNETKYRWEFNGDHATAEAYKVSPSRNFTAWEKINSKLERTRSGNGQDVLKEVAKGQTDKCDKFGNGPGAHPATSPLGVTHAGRSALLAPAERVALDLPGDGYPDAAISAAPAFAPHTATHGLTWIQVAHTLRAAQDKIAFGAAVVLGAIVLYTTRGALPPIEAPMTPSLSPLLGTDGHRYPGA